MSKNYIDEIIQISNNYDQKSASDKILKLVEEVGELSQAYLIHKNAHGTQFRDKSQYSVQEELADIYICMISLLPMLHIEKESFFQEVKRKMDKWVLKISKEIDTNESVVRNIINTDLIPIHMTNNGVAFTSKHLFEAGQEIDRVLKAAKQGQE